MPAPRVSVVIPAYNEQDTIGNCLLAAVDQTVPLHEIIVVDNRSTDETVGIVKAFQYAHPDAPIRLLHQDAAQGLVPTRNAGLDAATGEVIGRIDADSVLEPTWVEHVQATFASDEVAAASGPVVYYDMPLRRFGLRADDALRRLMLRLAREYYFLFGSNMAIRASAWREIRDEVCLDADEGLHEDIDLAVHLHEHRLPIAYVSSMVAGMSARRLDDSPRDYLYYVRRFERTYRRHRVRRVGVHAPMLVFLGIYPALRVVRRSKELRAILERMEPMGAPDRARMPTPTPSAALPPADAPGVAAGVAPSAAPAGAPAGAPDGGE
ncbi:glycosyltransferase family 2 protein [Galbitalea sp. SE-J8]|uniref:glycosyltransferase n=1 Tax=Galbitalea sp. SE-J8 TaxID=3054952 RepID=UPI0033905529